MSDPIGEANIFGIDATGLGGDFPIICPSCKTLLTIVKLNERCKLDINIECKICGNVGQAKNLWGENCGKI
jgi:hypothetical protein